MPLIRYHIELDKDEVKLLRDISGKGLSNYRRADALLLLDQGQYTSEHCTVAETAKRVGLSIRTLFQIKKRYIEGGVKSAVCRKPNKKPRLNTPIKCTEEVVGNILGLAASNPPDGRHFWTAKLLAEKAVELGYVQSISSVTVASLLRKNKESRNR